ncbi:hypothetical protein SUGI_1117430 [Cryptomeria japonica]|nr:hypothetical protein SUGI_1117430 [Cryptomeria japonica]
MNCYSLSFPCSLKGGQNYNRSDCLSDLKNFLRNLKLSGNKEGLRRKGLENTRLLYMALCGIHGQRHLNAALGWLLPSLHLIFQVGMLLQ